MSAIHLSSKVLIVGAGPVGLTLAHELLRRGVQVRLIEKEHTASQNARALGVWARTLELFAETGSGIVEEMLERGVKTPAFNIWSEGTRLACLDFAHQIAGPYPFILMIPQPETEVILTRHVLSLGGTIERGTELVSLTQQEEGVTAVLRTADGAEEEIRVEWLIGCDGARSTVRRLLDMPFVGKTLEQSFVTGNVRVQWDWPPEEGQAFLHRGNLVAFFPLPEAFQYRIVIAYQPGVVPEGEVTLEEIQQGIAAYGPVGARASEPDGLARFLVNQRKVERYMTGRVLLAGDAAHIHTFIGAQGMNTGIQDAFNLAWKLALVVNGRARAQLLESYEQEREHVSKELLVATGLASHFALLRQPLLRGLRDALAPRITSLTRTQRFIVNTLAELSISYRHSPIVSDAQGLRIWRRFRLQAGDRAPDGSVWEGSSPVEHRLFELLSGTRHTLLIFSPHPSSKVKALARLLPAFEDLIVSYQIIQGTNRRSEQEEIGKQFYDPDGLLAHRYGCANGGLVLIRPDGYIGFVSRQIEREHLQRYLQDLFFIAS